MAIVVTVKEQLRGALALFDKLDRRHKFLTVAAGSAAVVLGTCFLVFHEAIINGLAAASVRFRHVKLNWLILLLLNVAVSFPPLVGYSFLSLFIGMVFGFTVGWPLVAFGTLLGSTLSFITFRYFLRSYAEKLVQRSVHFNALDETMRQDSLKLVWMLRLCPLPYSFSNAAMSTIPSIEPWKFFVATLCATPKLLLHIFVGQQLVKLSDEANNRKWWANLFSIVLACSMGAVTSHIIYGRVKARVALIEQERGSYDAPETDDFEIDQDEP